MAKKSKNKIIEEVTECAVCANECTGALQRISIDSEEIAAFHAEYIGESKGKGKRK